MVVWVVAIFRSQSHLQVQQARERAVSSLTRVHKLTDELLYGAELPLRAGAVVHLTETKCTGITDDGRSRAAKGEGGTWLNQKCV